MDRLDPLMINPMKFTNEKEDQGVTSVEVYGFLGWITSAAAYVIYLLWAFIPSSILQQHGITYYPSKYWALAIPTWFCVTIIFIYWLYESLNMMSTKPRAASLTPNITPETKFFTETSDAGLLPLVEIPQEVIDMIEVQGMTAHDAEKKYKEKLFASPSK